MKRVFILLLAAMLLCTACSAKPNVEETEPPATAAPETEVPTTLPPETTEETVPVPELVYGLAKANQTPAILQTLMRDEIVDVVGEYDENHYVIKTELGYGLVRKNFLRMEGEVPYEVWTGYAYYNAEVYDNLYLTGEPAQQLRTNTKIEVLDDLGGWYVVRVEEATGFMRPERLSKWPFTSGGSKDSGGSSGGGGGGGSSSSSGADGGDISLSFKGGITLLSAIEQFGEVTGKAAVLADGVEVILGYFDREEEIPLVAEEGFAEPKEGFAAVYLDGLYAYVPQELIRMDGDEPFTQWEGYSRWNGQIFDNRYLLGEPVQKLTTNAKVLVLDELEGCYLVQSGEITGYMAKDLISEYRISTGGGSSGSSGSGSSGGEEWSPPAL